jgi:hypothetical protein
MIISPNIDFKETYLSHVDETLKQKKDESLFNFNGLADGIQFSREIYKKDLLYTASKIMESRNHLKWWYRLFIDQALFESLKDAIQIKIMKYENAT